MIFLAEETNFKKAELIKAISSMEGFNGIDIMEESEYTSYIGDYTFEGQRIYFEISKDFSHVSTYNLQRAGLNFALKLQQNLNLNLSATDTSYSFLCRLAHISNIEEFEHIVNQNIHMEYY